MLRVVVRIEPTIVRVSLLGPCAQIMEELHDLGPIDFESAGRAVYIRAVIQETLRYELCCHRPCHRIVGGSALALSCIQKPPLCVSCTCELLE